MADKAERLRTDLSAGTEMKDHKQYPRAEPSIPQNHQEVLCFLDDDSNCRGDFSELLSLVFHVAKACYKPLQQHQAPEDGEELTAQEKAGGEQLPGPRAAGRVSCNQQVPEQGVNNQHQKGILDSATPEQDRNTHKAEETDNPKQDPKTNQAQETDVPGQGSNHSQSPETESAEKNLNCSSETQVRGANNKTQV
nr:PREDICTED: cornulin-like [Phalacrocorax carbo]